MVNVPILGSTKHLRLSNSPWFFQFYTPIHQHLSQFNLQSCKSRHFRALLAQGTEKPPHNDCTLCWSVLSAPLLAQGTERPQRHDHIWKIRLPTPIFGRGNSYQQPRKKNNSDTI